MRVLALLLAGLLLSGCSLLPGDDSTGEDGRVKNVDERGTRTDLDPLTKRFPSIGDPRSATWQSGTLGDDRTAPGPSSYWIDAVITLDAGTTADLRAAERSGDVPGPDLVDAVADEVPDGDLTPVVVSGPDSWQVDAWLVDGTDDLVLSARGQ